MSVSQFGPQSSSPKSETARLVDPVCGMKVNPDSPHQTESGSKRYAFCSAGCKAKFLADPSKGSSAEFVGRDGGEFSVDA
jgi:YHS domain-containing protein